MEDDPDIVARLRESIFLGNIHHAYAQTDGTYAFPNSREGDMLKQAVREFLAMREDRDEIERLRAEVERLRAGGCARDQTTTQFCAEAERLRDRCNRLLHQLQEFEAREAQ